MKPTSAKARIVFAVLSLGIVFFGIGAILNSPILGYRNWWGGLVFGPAAILVGALFFFVLVMHPEKVGNNVRRRKRWR